MRDKGTRDDLCRQLSLSPEQQHSCPQTRVTARLTALETRDRIRVLDAIIQQGSGDGHSMANSTWVPGHQVQLAEDVAVVITECAIPFRIHSTC